MTAKDYRTHLAQDDRAITLCGRHIARADQIPDGAWRASFVPPLGVEAHIADVTCDMCRMVYRIRVGSELAAPPGLPPSL